MSLRTTCTPSKCPFQIEATFQILMSEIASIIIKIITILELLYCKILKNRILVLEI
jgi:hypothetical protein